MELNEKELYNNFKKLISSLKENNETKPKILLHACCAPCSSACLERICDAFNISIFYSNDNIQPEEEYNKRLETIKEFMAKAHNDIDVLYDKYNAKDYDDAILGHEHDGERSYRCYLCYKLRLRKTAIYAKAHGYDYFSTTLSISPYKVSKWINQIGLELEKEIGIKYLYSDFKKENGYNRSIELSNEYGLYRQDYCGCVYSKEEREEKKCQKK
jgi:predicted adenine nucleotide alpha hydrolase (AANH) superfamily ATPase